MVPSLIDDYQIPMKVYIKEDFLKKTDEKRPILFYLFGGAFHFEDQLWDKEEFLNMGFIIIHVRYRLCPKIKYPVPLEDAYSCLNYIQKLSHPLIKDHWDTRIALYGSSAGGNIAACSCLLMRERGLAMNVLCQILEYPALFYLENVKSHILYKDWYIHGEDTVRYIDNMYMRSEKDYENQYLCPMKAKDLTILPDAYFLLAERDYFCSEGEVYCEMLKKSGNNAVCMIYPQEHGFMGKSSIGKKALGELLKYLQKKLEETK